MKKGVLEISQNSQEKTCTRVTLLKKRLWHKCFPVNFAKFLRTLFYRTLWTTASLITWIFTGIYIVIVSTKSVAQRRI